MKYLSKRRRKAGMMSMVLVLVILFLIVTVTTVTIMGTAARIQTFSTQQSSVVFAIDSALNLIRANGSEYIRSAISSGSNVSDSWESSLGMGIPLNLKAYISSASFESRQDYCTLSDGTGYVGIVYICSISFESDDIAESYKLVFAGQDYNNIRIGDFLGYA